MAEWRELMDAAARELRLGGEIAFGSGQRIELDGAQVAALTIEEGADGALSPGDVLCARCTLDLINDEGQWNAGGALLGGRLLTGATLLPKLGAINGENALWRPLGAFQVERASYLESEAKLRLEGVDAIGCELGAEFVDDLSYPATLSALWQRALEQTRFVWSGDVPNGTAVVSTAPEWKGASVRGAMGAIAAAAGCFVAMDRSGGIELRPVWSADAPRTISAQTYVKLDRGDAGYGPVDALKLKPVGADEERVYRATPNGSALCALRVSENPLFRADAAGLDALAQGALDAIAGFQSADLRFDWRGDPELRVGDRVSLTDRGETQHAGVLSRQTLRFSNGLSASCVCAVPEAANAGVRRALTPEGGLNAAALTGAVDGALLSVGSVTTNKLAAGSVTAEKLESGSVDAHIVTAVKGKFGEITAGNLETDELGAELARILRLVAKTADVDFAHIKDLATDTAIITEGVGGKLMISRLAVTEANMVSLTTGELVVKGADGRFYSVSVGANGQITTELKQIGNGDVLDLSINAGEKLIEGSVTTACLNATEIFADSETVRELIAANLKASTLFANDAFVSALRTSQIFGGKSLTMIAGDVAALEAGASGRNLLRNSKTLEGWEYESSNNQYFSRYKDEDGFGIIKMSVSGLTSDSYKSVVSPAFSAATIKGKDFVFSVMVKMEDVSTISQDMPVIAVGGYKAEGSKWVRNVYFSTGPNTSFTNQPTFVAGQWVKFSLYGAFTEDFLQYSDNAQVPWDSIVEFRVFLYIKRNGTIHWKQPKMEIGTRATDWSEAPEDSETIISPDPPIWDICHVGTTWLDQGVNPWVLRSWVGGKNVSTTENFVVEKTQKNLLAGEYGTIADFDALEIQFLPQVGLNADGSKKILTTKNTKLVFSGHNLFDLRNAYRLSGAAGASSVNISNNSLDISYSGATNIAWSVEQLWFPLSKGDYRLSEIASTTDASYSPALSVYYTSFPIISDIEILDSINGTGEKSITFTMPVDGFIGLFFHGTTETGTTGARQVKYADIMLSTLDYNEYEPVESNVYEIDLGGGYAGGKYNLLTGELTIEWQLMNLNGTENWMLFDCQNTAYKRMRLMNPINTVEPPPNNDTVANIICSHYDTVTAGQTYLQVKGVAVQQWDDQNPDLICFYDPAYQTVESWKAHLAQLNAAGTPIAIAYKMRTPIKTQVPPPDIRPLPGYNAISSFYGNIYAKWTASGWRTVSDTAQIEEALGQAQTEIDKNNNRIEEVNTNLESRVRLDSYGLHVGDSSTNNEILLQSGGVPEIHFVIDGKTAGKIGASFHQFGNMELRVPQAKGFVMQAIEE